jgi:hypothetical protein
VDDVDKIEAVVSAEVLVAALVERTDLVGFVVESVVVEAIGVMVI